MFRGGRRGGWVLAGVTVDGWVSPVVPGCGGQD